MSAASDIVAALDALILAKLQGTTDIGSLFNRTLDKFSINPATSLTELTRLRAQWQTIVNTDDGGAMEAETYVI